MDEQKPKWDRFEDLVESIQRKLTPHWEVIRKHKVRGRRSKRVRELDIALLGQAGPASLMVVFDCKDYRRPVNVKDVEAFLGLIDDVGANKGVLVAARGYTKAAKERARDAGVEVLRVVDAEKHEWGSLVSASTLIIDRRIPRAGLRLSGFGGGIRIPMNVNPFSLHLYRADGTDLGPVQDLVSARWQSDAWPEKPGRYEALNIIDEPTYYPTENGFEQLTVQANIDIDEVLFFGQTPITSIKGFRDEIGGATTTDGFETAKVDFRDVERDWQRVRSADDLPSQPMLTLHVRSAFPRLSEK